MHLKSLELVGFKSFAKKATLDFTSSITGIVGPNGSGKSNVAEAFRFVLGEQSIKSLRGKRGEDMIWNGGGESGRSQRASVKVIFDNSSKLFQSIDFDQVSIERVVHRDNSNEYLLNGSQVRLRDIVELLAGAHIGATGHHIISQGEADRILSASIRERREMIEDALGLKMYQWKKLESIKKLERTEENMKQVESLRREIAPHLKFLKKQVEKVEKAEELRKELILLYKEYFSNQEYYLMTEKERISNELRGPSLELKDLERELDRARKILVDSKNKDKKSDAVITLEGKLASTRSEKDTITRELGRLEGEISANRRAIEKEELRIKNEELRTVHLRDVEVVVRNIESLDSINDVKKLYTEVVLLLREFISRHKIKSDSDLIKDAETEIHSLAKSKIDFEKKLESLARTESEIARDYNDLKGVIEREKDTNREAEKDVFRIIARQNEVRNIFDQLTRSEQALKHEEEAFKKELGEAGMVAGREAVQFNNSTLLRISLRSSFEGQAIQQFNNSREKQEELRRKIEKNKIRLEDSGGLGGSEVMKEYKETEDRDQFLAKELLDLDKAKKELEQLIIELDTRIDVEFRTGILKINDEFQKYFVLMFGGGRAELSLVKEIRRRKKTDKEDLDDALSGHDEDGEFNENETEEGPEGLEVNVSLPRKKIKGLMMLSGGERALTSIALLFAVSQVNPPPFIILDETDAALDEANSRKYGDMIENLSKHSQLILITHNRETMSRAGVIYGVTMGSDGASRLLSIQFEDAVKVAK